VTPADPCTIGVEREAVAMMALEGTRVLDLTQVMAGPFCSMLLADMGADVVKIEPPGGETTRHTEPEIAPGVAAAFLAVNRNKRGITLDLKQVEDSSRGLSPPPTCSWKTTGPALPAASASTTRRSPASTRASSTARSPGSGRPALTPAAVAPIWWRRP
jgi:CoA-transferase family III